DGEGAGGGGERGDPREPGQLDGPDAAHPGAVEPGGGEGAEGGGDRDHGADGPGEQVVACGGDPVDGGPGGDDGEGVGAHEQRAKGWAGWWADGGTGVRVPDARRDPAEQLHPPELVQHRHDSSARPEHRGAAWSSLTLATSSRHGKWQ